MRAWVLDADGVPCALDDGPISRGIKGAAVQLQTHEIASIAQTSSPALQVLIQVMLTQCRCCPALPHAYT